MFYVRSVLNDCVVKWLSDITLMFFFFFLSILTSNCIGRTTKVYHILKFVFVYQVHSVKPSIELINNGPKTFH